MTQHFNKGKICKITNDFNNDVYVGSTCDTLVKRFSMYLASGFSARRKYMSDMISEM